MFSEIEAVEIVDIVGASYNPRSISDAELRKLMRSIETFGFVEPVIVNKRTPEKGWSVTAKDAEGNKKYQPEELQATIVGGHQRVKAALSLGWERVPVVWVDLNEVEEVSLNIALNKIQGVWNEEKLVEAFDIIRNNNDFPDFDPEVSGFELTDMDALIETFSIDPPEDFPDVDSDQVERETDYKCPSCGYMWSGDPSPGRKPKDDDDDPFEQDVDMPEDDEALA